MNPNPLPTEEQRRALGELMHQAFVELRYLDGDQAHDLAYAFHNLPLEIYGWGNWDITAKRTQFQHYHSKHQQNLGFNYVQAFNEIFPSSA